MTTTNIIKITDKFYIETSVNANNLPTAKLVQNTPKAKYSKTKTLKNYYFKSEERRNEWVAETIAEYQKSENAKIERREKIAELVKTAKVAIGDMFVYSWGWEQTNIQFYQVTNIKGQTLELREVKQNRRATGDMTGYCTPIYDDFKNEKPWNKRIKCLSDGKPYVSTEFGWCSLWDGGEESWTAYA